MKSADTICAENTSPQVPSLNKVLFESPADEAHVNLKIVETLSTCDSQTPGSKKMSAVRYVRETFGGSASKVSDDKSQILPAEDDVIIAGTEVRHLPKPRRSKTPSAKKLEAARHALEAAGMSVSKRNVDTYSAKKKAANEAAKKRRISELENARTVLEKKEKDEKASLQRLKKQKVKLERQLEVKEKNTFPVSDELILLVDRKGEEPTPLPIPAMKLDVDDSQVQDILFVWDFLCTFKKELAVLAIGIEDFVEILQYTGTPSPIITEVFCGLMRLLLRDHSLSMRLNADIPPHLNFASRDSINDSLDALCESSSIERYRDWDYNGLRLLPRKIRAELVDGLRYQSLLRAVIPRLPSYRDLLRALDPSYDLLVASEQLAGLYGEGYQSPNRDYTSCIMTDVHGDVKVAKAALQSLESMELYQLPVEQKLILLKLMCFACYDTSIVRHLLARHAEERISQTTALHNHQKDKKRKILTESAALREVALEECRQVNMKLKKGNISGDDRTAQQLEVSGNDIPDETSNSTKANKKTIKNTFDPTPSQLNAMVEDMRLRQNLGLDVVLEDYPIDLANGDDPLQVQSRSLLSSSRVLGAEMERRRKEREQAALMREDSAHFLEQALANKTEKDVRSSIKYAKQAGLEGTLNDGRKFCTSLLFQVYKLRAGMDKTAKAAREVEEHEKALMAYFVRSEPLGLDRFYNAYWFFEGDAKLYVQKFVRDERTAAAAAAAAALRENDVFAPVYRDPPSATRSSWRIYASMWEIWALIDALDDRGLREKALKSKLRAKFGFADNSNGYRTSGNEYIGKKVKRKFRKRSVIGTIVGWLPPDGEDEALWHVIHEDGDEEDLDAHELEQCLCSVDVEEATGDADVAPSSCMEESDDGERTCQHEPPEIASSYYNSAVGGLKIRNHDIDISGLRQEMLLKQNLLLDGLKSRGSTYSRDGKKAWEAQVRNADDVDTLRGALMELESVVHDTQEAADEVDENDIKDKRKLMIVDGWVFDPAADGEAVLLKLRTSADEALAACDGSSLDSRREQPCRKGNSQSDRKTTIQLHADACRAEYEETQQGLVFIGRRVRKFFSGHGKSDGNIVAYLRGGLNDGVSLWHMEHDDGDCEDLDKSDLERALNYFDADAQEEDYCDDEVEADDGKDPSSVSVSDSDEESENDSDGCDNSDSREVLWPSLNVRSRWLSAVESSKTISELALALGSLMESAKAFGIADTNEGSGPRTKNMWSSIRSPSRRSSGTYGQITVGSTKKFKTGGGRRSSTKAIQGNRRLLRDRAARRLSG